MRRFAICWLTFMLASFAATKPWNLVLKDGSTVACDGPPVVINDEYLFRSVDGKDGSVPADEVDKQKTDRANKVTPPPREWQLIGETVHESPRGPLAGSDANFTSEVLESRTPVLVEFWATWCGYCRKMEPTIQSLSSEYAGRLKIYKVDIDKNPAIGHRYGVRGLPTLLLFNRGEVAGTILGAADKSTVTRMLASQL